jgi:cytosine/adenosine deaminase-related metal-dependent hydrolase
VLCARGVRDDDTAEGLTITIPDHWKVCSANARASEVCMKCALTGRIVTMNPQRTVHEHGTIYIDGRDIVALGDSHAPRPPGFADSVALHTSGTIYPGLIELHNHLAYDILAPWKVDRKYDNRNQWSTGARYQSSVTTPMTVLARIPSLVPAIARYTEAKCLLGGTTTSQGIGLFSNQGIQHYYRGLVRNVEQTYDAALPEAKCRIGDVEKKDTPAFLERLKRASCFLLHLSEGSDQEARSHFLALQMGSKWAITPALSGIHCNALTEGDFETMSRYGASMVWSPVSNYLLYGSTANIAAATKAGLRIGIGPDWSYSGSKNLLAELNVARLIAGGSIDDATLVAMATCDAAAILGWSAVLGSLEAQRWADLIVLHGTTKDPYEQLLTSTEADIAFTMINGAPVYGTSAHMKTLGVSGEAVAVGPETRIISLQDPDADPAVRAMSLHDACALLDDALHDLPRLASEQNRRPKPSHAPHLLDPHSPEPPEPVWFLALDQTPHDFSARTRSPQRHDGIAGPITSHAAQAVSPMTLDPLTTVDDRDYYEVLVSQVNLPEELRDKIRDRFL